MSPCAVRSCYYMIPYKIQYHQCRQSAFFCLRRPGHRAHGLCLATDKINQSSRFHPCPQGKTESLARNDDRTDNIQSISQQLSSPFSLLILFFQASSPKPIRGFLLLPSPGLQATSPATLAAVRAVGKEQLRRLATSSSPTFQANLYAATSVVS